MATINALSRPSAPPARRSPIVFGLDLSLAATGMVTPTRRERLATSPRELLQLRLISIRQRIGAAVTAEAPDLVLIEDLPSHVAHGGTMLGMVHGVVRTLLYEAGQHVILVPPATLKKYVAGKGGASKSDMRVAILRRFDLDLADDNVADAFGLMAMGLDLLEHPLVVVPAAQRDVLTKLADQLTRP
jgi:Holliday junction resolvasome RuvABC endonuclease subunit